MTANVTIPFSQFPGDGITTSFALTWPSVAPTDLLVEQVQGITRVAMNYGIDWNPDTAAPYAVRTVMTTFAVPVGWVLEVQRRTTLDQLTDYISNDGFPADATERGFDKITYALQEQDRRIGLVESSGAGAGYTFSNIPGTGLGVFADVIGNNVRFKPLEPGAGILMNDDGSRILIESTGVTFPIDISQGGTGETLAQLAINALSQVGAGGNEHVLTKDTASGDAVWKPAPGVTPPANTYTLLRGDGTWVSTLTGPLQIEGNPGAANGGSLKLYQAAAGADQKRWSLEGVYPSLFLRIRKDDETGPLNVIRWDRGAGPSIGPMFVLAPRMIVGSTDDATTALQVTGGAKLHTGDLTFASGASLITGPWDDTAVAPAFKSSSGSGYTVVAAVPPVGGAVSGFRAYNDPNRAGAVGVIELNTDAAYGRVIVAGINGGTDLPLRIWTGGQDRFEFGLIGAKALAFLGWALVANGNSGAAKTIDWGAGNFQTVTMNGNCTFTFTAPPSPGVCYLLATQDGTGSRVWTLPAAAKWTAATAAGDKLLSTGAAKRDLAVFLYNGTDYLTQLFKDF